MFASTKQSVLAFLFVLFAIFCTVVPAQAAQIGNILCGTFIALVVIFAIFCTIGWWSQRGQVQSSNNIEDEAE